MIGVAISTHKRPDVLAKSLGLWAQAMPDVLVVNHDVSGEGIAVMKNRGLAALMDAGCDHLFLADDDMGPVAPWAKHYVDNRSPHLMHCWGRSRYLYTEDGCTVWKWPRGVLLYVERRVVERVGGMRLDFGHAGGEHVEYSRRVHNCGFTNHQFQDAAGAHRGVWHCEDYERKVASSLPASRYSDPAVAAHRHHLFDLYRHSTDFVPYR